MKLPNLNQRIELDRGQPQLVLIALQAVQDEIIKRDPQRGQRISTREALSLKPLTRLIKRVQGLAERDGQVWSVRKRHRFQVEYDELATMRLYYARLLSTTDDWVEHARLTDALGRFHQPSLNLEGHIQLPAPTGPGCQGLLL